MRDIKGIIFDLDQTLVDSRCALNDRRRGNWSRVYSLISHFVVYDGLRNLLTILSKSNVKILVVTSTPASYCKRVLSYHELPFDGCICYHDTNYHKPHPEPMYMALSWLGHEVNKVVSVGDDPKDILSSRAAGIFPIAAGWGSIEYKELVSSPWMKFCNTTHELEDFFRDLGMVMFS